MRATVRVLLVGAEADQRWAGPGVAVVPWAGDLRRVPFRAVRGDIDVVVVAAPLPAALGPLPVPVIGLPAVPCEVGAARRMLLRLLGDAAAGGTPFPGAEGATALGPLNPCPGMPDAALDPLRRAAQVDLPRQRARLGRACAVLAEGLRAARPPDPLAALALRRAAWRPVPGRVPRRQPPVPVAVPAARARPTTAAAPGGAPLVLLLGPVDHLSEVEGLSDALEAWPGLSIRFRLFRGGLYRLDGRTGDVEGVRRWLLRRTDVASVVRDGEILHVLPAEGAGDGAGW